MKQFLLIQALSFSFYLTLGQDLNKDLIPHLKTLYVGDTVPNLFVTGFYHHPGSGEYISSLYKNKLLILDFWQTHCGSCISAFPRIEKLEKKFGSRLQVLEVTDQSEKVVQDFFRKQEKAMGRRYTTAGILGDSILNRIFPHESIPHCVWIDQSGKVLAITAGQEVNEENIAAVLNGRFISLPLKDDSIPLRFHNINKPLFINGNGGDGKSIIRYSVLSKYVKGLQNIVSFGFPDSSGNVEVQIPNSDILTLYKRAYSDDTEFHDARLPNARIRFEMDSSIFSADSAGHFLTDRCYCYNLLIPKADSANFKTLMQEDLKRFFGFEARWEKKKIKCLVLTIDDTNRIRLTRTNFSDEEMANGASDANFYSFGYSMSFVKFIFAEDYFFYSPYPVLDETGYKGWAEFYLDADMHDWKAVNKALSTYTMHLTLQDREMNVLIVKKPKTQVGKG